MDISANYVARYAKDGLPGVWVETLNDQYLKPTSFLCFYEPLDSTVNLRIETNISTLYEDPITSGNPPPPSNTPIDALDAAAKALGFTYDGSADPEYDDFCITGIANWPDFDAGTYHYLWGSLVNYQVSDFGEQLSLSGCHQLAKAGDEVFWVHIPYTQFEFANTASDTSFLKLRPTALTVKKAKGTTVTVTDGRTGNKTQGASVAGVKTDAKGQATLYFFKTGFYQSKAHRTGDVRSNVMNITVTN